MIPGMKGREGLRMTQLLMEAAKGITPEQVMTLDQSTLIKQIESLTAMSAEDREMFGRQLNAMSKEPIEIVQDFLEKILDKITTIASAGVWKWLGGKSAENMLSARIRSDTINNGINQMDLTSR